MTTLQNFTADTYSQFGEDGVIEHIFSIIGTRSKVAVEFGASDGLSCSNTALLWRHQGWSAFLVEPEPSLFDELEGNTHSYDVVCCRSFVEPTGSLSITELMATHNINEPDFMSIDIDGDDWFVLRDLKCRPRVLTIEFNPTIPPHISLYPRTRKTMMGASLRAMVTTGEQRGYRFIGATYANAFFVLNEEAEPFVNYERNIEVLFPLKGYTFAITDLVGHPLLCGDSLPWGAREPCAYDVEADVLIRPVTTVPQAIRQGFEAIWGIGIWVAAAALSVDRLVHELRQRPPLVCIDVTQQGPEINPKYLETIESFNYYAIRSGPVLGLVPKEQILT